MLPRASGLSTGVAGHGHCRCALWYDDDVKLELSILRGFLAIAAVLVLVTHICVPAVAGLAWAAHESTEHGGDAHHQGVHDGGCEMLRANVVGASPVAIRASESLDPQVRHVTAIVSEQAANLQSRPPRFLLHAALLL
jgi:hypothetical protein